MKKVFTEEKTLFQNFLNTFFLSVHEPWDFVLLDKIKIS